MNNNKTHIILILIVVIFGCIKEEIIDNGIESTLSHLTVYSIVSPQSDSIFVSITNLSPLNKIYNHKTLPDGIVTISGNNESITLNRIKEKPSVYACSSKEFVINKGITYKLNIEIPGYHTVSAATSIPTDFSKWISPRLPVPGISLINNRYYKTYTFHSGWNKSEYNYFSKRIYGVRFDHKKVEFDSLGNFIFYPENTASIPLTPSNYNHFRTNNKISDYTDSSTIKITTTAGYSNKDNDLWIRPDVLYHGITYYIYTVDKNFSDFIELQTQYLDPPWSDATRIEPRIDYILPSTSNIEGGYGLFGSYGYDSVYYDFSNLQNFYENN